MKKHVIILSLFVVAGSVLLSGCSKSKTATTASGNNRNGSEATAVSLASDEPVDMKIKWTIGKKYPMHIELGQSTKTDVPNQPQPVVQEMNLTQDFDISPLKQLDGGGTQLELQFNNQAINVSQGGQTVLAFNSTQSPGQDGSDPAVAVLRAMLGARIQYFTDANGKVERKEGVDALTKRIAATGQPRAETAFKQMFGEDTLKRYCSFADGMPNRTIKVGESWPFQEDLPTSIGVLALDMKYTFKNWEQYSSRKCAHIVGAGRISTKTVSTATGAMVEVEKGTITGDFWFDPALGMIVGFNDMEDMALKITTRAQAMKTQFNQKMRYALVDAP
jgi:hypothetical protein